MNKIAALFAFIFLCCTLTTKAQPQLSPKATVKSENIEITYSQPAKRDRVVFGELVPYNEVWRTGANEATEVTLKKDLTIGGKTVKAGTYTLFTVPGEKEWRVILNSQLGQWGAYDYDKYKSKDVLDIKVPSRKLANTVEKLTITPKKDEITIEWDQTGVSVPVKI
jgi:hypothetical protein